MAAIAPEIILSSYFLDPEDYHRLTPIFEENEGALPLPSISQIAVVEREDTNEIVGFYVFQLIPHAEPMWIHPDFRSSGVWVQLASMIEPLTNRRDTYIIATTPQTIAMCDRLGLAKIEHPVYVKRAI